MNVLLVDDDQNAALLFRLVAERLGDRVRLEVAQDGQEAIDYLAGKGPYSDRASHPLPDLVVLDLVMPGVTGFDVLDWCRSRPELCSLPKIVFSGSLRDEDIKAAIAKGAARFIPKPIDLSQLKTAIREMLNLAEQCQ